MTKAQKAGRNLTVAGALMVIGGCIAQLWPYAVFVFVGIAMVGMMLEGDARARKS